MVPHVSLPASFDMVGLCCPPRWSWTLVCSTIYCMTLVGILGRLCYFCNLELHWTQLRRKPAYKALCVSKNFATTDRTRHGANTYIYPAIWTRKRRKFQSQHKKHLILKHGPCKINRGRSCMTYELDALCKCGLRRRFGGMCKSWWKTIRLFALSLASLDQAREPSWTAETLKGQCGWGDSFIVIAPFGSIGETLVCTSDSWEVLRFRFLEF